MISNPAVVNHTQSHAILGRFESYIFIYAQIF
jgi:hypothetical protein